MPITPVKVLAQESNHGTVKMLLRNWKKFTNKRQNFYSCPKIVSIISLIWTNAKNKLGI
jgi:hypothetical protein